MRQRRRRTRPCEYESGGDHLSPVFTMSSETYSMSSWENMSQKCRLGSRVTCKHRETEKEFGKNKSAGNTNKQQVKRLVAKPEICGGDQNGAKKSPQIDKSVTSQLCLTRSIEQHYFTSLSLLTYKKTHLLCLN